MNECVDDLECYIQYFKIHMRNYFQGVFVYYKTGETVFVSLMDFISVLTAPNV